MNRITLLGATGSIGASTLDVLARHPECFSLFAVTAGSSVEGLSAICARFRPRFAVIADDRRRSALRCTCTWTTAPLTRCWSFRGRGA